MSRTLLLSLLPLSMAACVQSSYAVTQAGLVPAPRALPYDGQPLDRSARLEGRVSTAIAPTEDAVDSGDSGNLVARHHAGVAARKRLGSSNTDIGLEFDTAFVDGADPVQAGLGPAPETGGAWQLTWGIRHSLRLADDVRLGVGFTMGFAEVPVRVGAAQTESDTAGIYQFGLVPSWRRGPLVAFGSMTISSEVDVPRVIIANDSFDTPQARAAGGVLILAAGATYELSDSLRLTGRLAQPTGSSIASYGPQLDLVLGFDLGDAPRSRAPGPSAPPPTGPPGAQPPPAPYPRPY